MFFLIIKRKWNRLRLKKEILNLYQAEVDRTWEEYRLWVKRREATFLENSAVIGEIDWKERRESGKQLLRLVGELRRINSTSKRIGLFIAKES